MAPHSGAVPRAGLLLLVDLLVGVGGVEPARPLLLLLLREGVLPQSRVDAAVVKVVEGGGRRGDLHIAACPRALQQHGEAVGIARPVALRGRERGEEVGTRHLETSLLVSQFSSAGAPEVSEVLGNQSYFYSCFLVTAGAAFHLAALKAFH